MITLVFLVLAVALTASLARLARVDVITAGFRVKVREWSGEHGFFTDMLECHRCTSVWTAPPAVGILGAGLLAVSDVTWTTWLVAALLWIPVSFGVSYLAFLLYLLEGNN